MPVNLDDVEQIDDVPGKERPHRRAVAQSFERINANQAAVEALVNQLETDVGTNATAITALQGSVSTNTADIATNAAAIAALTSSPEIILERGTISVAQANLEVSWGSTVYDKVVLEWANLAPVSASFLMARLSEDNGSTFVSTADYHTAANGRTSNNVFTSVAGDDFQQAFLSSGTTAGVSAGTSDGFLLLQRPDKAQITHVMYRHYHTFTLDRFAFIDGMFVLDNATLVNGIQLYFNDTNGNGGTKINHDAGTYVLRAWPNA